MCAGFVSACVVCWGGLFECVCGCGMCCRQFRWLYIDRNVHAFRNRSSGAAEYVHAEFTHHICILYVQQFVCAVTAAGIRMLLIPWPYQAHLIRVNTRSVHVTSRNSSRSNPSTHKEVVHPIRAALRELSRSFRRNCVQHTHAGQIPISSNVVAVYVPVYIIFITSTTLAPERRLK